MFISKQLSLITKLSNKKMIVNKTIGVVGGGISSLSLLLNMAKRINF
jgi:hypothetical protein